MSDSKWFAPQYEVAFTPQVAGQVAADQEKFGVVLEAALQGIAYQPPEDDVDVLLLAAGHCIEAPVLATQLTGGQPERARVTAIDQIPLVPVSRAMLRLGENGEPALDQYVQGDASRLGDYPHIPASVDVAVIRRQNVLEDTESNQSWHGLFAQSMDRLAAGGLTIVTSLAYHGGSRSHREMLKAFRQLGHQPILDEHTPLYRESRDARPVFQYPIDGHVAIFQKTSN